MDFDLFYDWVESYFRINLHAYKQKQLQRRIQTIMKQSGAETLTDYSVIIQENPLIRKDFLDYITINVTEFFRNKELFDRFEEIIAEDLSKKFPKLKIWSAACSIGSEPYSLAMILHRQGIKLDQQILATDIDETILNRAKKGIYKEHELKNVSLPDRSDFFLEEDKQYVLQDRIKRAVDFKKHDLVIDKYEKGFHAIVCRNVTIYFKNEVKEDIYQKFSDSLVLGGLFFTGATETIYRPEKYGLKKVASFIYEKVS
ncbi:CheR family methyltransferase [Lacticigenium naphthae]|uniref:CheR family methyltransferase n=1 Tax=Lacticigenium naphthae TaxID=515351 RepID=UPI0003FC0E7A|nr:protein-glutamate O-methyltransferase CheR [Lacticigenium naphthae]